MNVFDLGTTWSLQAGQARYLGESYPASKTQAHHYVVFITASLQRPVARPAPPPVTNPVTFSITLVDPNGVDWKAVARRSGAFGDDQGLIDALSSKGASVLAKTTLKLVATTQGGIAYQTSKGTGIRITITSEAVMKKTVRAALRVERRNAGPGQSDADDNSTAALDLPRGMTTRVDLPSRSGHPLIAFVKAT